MKKNTSETEKKSKFNVGNGKKNIEKRTYDGVIFDSDMECKYYKDVLLPLKEKGEVLSIILQPKFLLQESYEKYGKKILPIYYVADFTVVYKDNSEIVVDVKGMIPEVAKIKRKIFDKVYPNKILKWITLSIKYGGWLECGKLQKLRTKAKRGKRNNNGNEDASL